MALPGGMLDSSEKKLTQFGKLLEKQKLSQSQIARDFGLSRYYVWQLCWGLQVSGPSRQLREDIAEWAWKYFKVRINEKKWPEPKPAASQRGAATTGRSLPRPTRRPATSGSSRTAR